MGRLENGVNGSFDGSIFTGRANLRLLRWAIANNHVGLDPCSLSTASHGWLLVSRRRPQCVGAMVNDQG